MSGIIIALLIMLIVLIFFKNEKSDKTKIKTTKELPDIEEQKFPYEKKYLLTKTEYEFYSILKEKCDTKNLLICPKVRLEDFIKINTKENVMKYRGYIKSRHIDFLICDNKLNIIMGIELDDKTHQTQKAQKTDEFKNKLFDTIKIPLKRIQTEKNKYETKIDEILSTIK